MIEQKFEQELKAVFWAKQAFIPGEHHGIEATLLRLFSTVCGEEGFNAQRVEKSAMMNWFPDVLNEVEEKFTGQMLIYQLAEYLDCSIAGNFSSEDHLKHIGVTLVAIWEYFTSDKERDEFVSRLVVAVN